MEGIVHLQVSNAEVRLLRDTIQLVLNRLIVDQSCVSQACHVQRILKSGILAPILPQDLSLRDLVEFASSHVVSLIGFCLVGLSLK